MHGASGREDDPGDDRVASSTLKPVLERRPRISCKVCRAPGRNVARAPAALRSLRMPGSRMDPMGISSYLETILRLSFLTRQKKESIELFTIISLASSKSEKMSCAYYLIYFASRF